MITILDLVQATVGKKDSYSYRDHIDTGVAMMGGCVRCEASLASYNAYPSKSGYWACALCIGDNGYATVDEYNADIHGAPEVTEGHWTVWWDHWQYVASDVTAANVDAKDLSNVFVGDVPSRELAEKIAAAFKEELDALGFKIFVAVSN